MREKKLEGKNHCNFLIISIYIYYRNNQCMKELFTHLQYKLWIDVFFGNIRVEIG